MHVPHIRVPLVLVPALFLAGFIFFVTVAAVLLITRPTGQAAPQPLTFDHSVHVQIAGLDCSFCHRTASLGATAGYPDVQQCMFCHQVIAQVSRAPQQYQSDLQRVRDAWTQQQPIDWARIHRVPDHVHFVHASHIRAGVDCATCHGDVGNKAGQVVQVRSLLMGDCVSCHRERGAPTECVTCHY